MLERPEQNITNSETDSVYFQFLLAEVAQASFTLFSPSLFPSISFRQ